MLRNGYRVHRNDNKGRNNPAITQPTADKKTAQGIADRLNETYGSTTLYYVHSWSNPFDEYGRRREDYLG